MGVVASESKDWLAATTAEGELVFLSISTLQEKSRLRLHDGRPTALAYSPTLELIATGGEDRQIQLVSTQQSRGVLVTLNEHQGTVRSLLFDSTTPRLLSGGDDGLVRLWDLRDVSAPPTELRKKIEQQYGLVLESGRVVPTKSHR
jgi:WD40 repeat protein